jgi:VCBS repeat-containing protein
VIQGGNDQGVITGTTSGSVTEKSGVSNGTAGVATASGDLNVDDPDGANDDVWTAATNANATYGNYTVSTSGAWTYTLNDDAADVQALNVGGTLTDSFVVTSADGGSTTISVTINGANDSGVISGNVSGDVTEATAANAGTSSVSGTLSVTDLDDPQAFTAVSAGATSTSGYGTWGVTSAGVWTYNLNNANGTVQALTTGATLTDSFTVATAGGTTQLVTVTITGANDAPYVSSTVHANNGPLTGVTETTINSNEALSFSERNVFTFTGPTFADFEVGSFGTTLQASLDGGISWVTPAAALDTANPIPYLAYSDNKVTVGRVFGGTLNSNQQILLKFTATDSGSLSTDVEVVLKYDTAAGQVTVSNSTNGESPRYGIDGTASAIYGTSNGETITGTSGSDWIYAGPGNDTINAGAGADTLSYVYATGGVTVNYSTGANGTVTGADGTDTFNAVESIYGTRFNDVFNGSGSANTLFGGAGNDEIDGKAGNDTLQGGDGNDTITGGTGADTIGGGSGDDLLYIDQQDTVTGGSGADAFAYGGAINATTWVSIKDYSWSEGDTFRLSNSYAPGDIAITYDGDADETILQVSKSGDPSDTYTIAALNGDLSDLDSNGNPTGTSFDSLIASFRNASGNSFG